MIIRLPVCCLFPHASCCVKMRCLVCTQLITKLLHGDVTFSFKHTMATHIRYRHLFALAFCLVFSIKLYFTDVPSKLLLVLKTRSTFNNMTFSFFYETLKNYPEWCRHLGRSFKTPTQDVEMFPCGILQHIVWMLLVITCNIRNKYSINAVFLWKMFWSR